MTTAAELPVLPTLDKRGTGERSRLSEVGRQHLSGLHQELPPVRQVLTMHERYGQPPGDLAYTAVQDWTPEQQERGAKWLASQQSAEWWRAQGMAQRAVP